MSQATDGELQQIREAVDKGGSRTVQARGEWTLPKDWRDRHDLGKDDEVYYRENDDGTLTLIPPQ